MVKQGSTFNLENFNWSAHYFIRNCSLHITNLSDRPISMPVAIPSRLNHTPPPEDVPRALTPGLEEPDESTVHPRSSPQEPGESVVLECFVCLSRVSSDTLAL